MNAGNFSPRQQSIPILDEKGKYGLANRAKIKLNIRGNFADLAISRGETGKPVASQVSHSVSSKSPLEMSRSQARRAGRTCIELMSGTPHI